MSRYTNESPMDFQFENGTGPLDGRSPFAQLNSNARRLGDLSPEKSQRTQSGFDSPSKSRMGNSPNKPLPAAPPVWASSLYNTPRKRKEEFDDSSAGETPKSPEREDSDANTPEMRKSRTTLTRVDAPSAVSPSRPRPEAQRRASLFQKVKNKLYSPGRGEISRPEHAGAIEKASRRRRRDVDRRVARKRRHSMSDSGEDADPPPHKTARTNPDEKGPHWAGSLFTFLAQHPSLPQTLSYYAQFLFNLFLLACCGYLIYCFWSAVLGDVDKKSHEAMADILAEMHKCAESYEMNRCDPKTRPPALDNLCNNWKRCSEQDPTKVGRARVSASTFAEIFNSFVEPISYKAMFFTAIMVFGCFGISNFAFGFFRNKAAQQYQHPYNPYPYGPPPPTPQRSFSGQEGGGFYAGTPWHQPPPGVGFEPQPSGGYGQIEGQGSPQRRLVYN